MTAIYIAFNIIMALLVINMVGLETWLGLLMLGAINIAGNFLLAYIAEETKNHKAREQVRRHFNQQNYQAWKTRAQKAANGMYNRPPTKNVNPNHIERLPKR